MKNIFLVGVCVLSFVACTSSSDSNNENKDNATVEALSEQNSNQKTEEIEMPHLSFIEDNFSKLNFPINIDTVVFDESKKLSKEFALQLEKRVKDDGKRYVLQFPSFVKLATLKEGQNPVESNKFDIGESISVIYYDMGYTFLEQQNKWIALVGVEYEGYPACPWGSGREIVLCSFDGDANFIDATIIAENSEGGDPPVWGKTIKKVASQNGQTYQLDIVDISGEEDESGNSFEDVSKRKAKVMISPDGKMQVEFEKKG